jgi:hypothetical protein
MNVILHQLWSTALSKRTMSSSVHGATSALSMGPSVGYNSIFEFVKFNIFSAMIYMSFMFISATSASVISHTCTYMLSPICYGFSRLN